MPIDYGAAYRASYNQGRTQAQQRNRRRIGSRFANAMAMGDINEMDAASRQAMEWGDYDAHDWFSRIGDMRAAGARYRNALAPTPPPTPQQQPTLPRPYFGPEHTSPLTLPSNVNAPPQATPQPQAQATPQPQATQAPGPTPITPPITHKVGLDPKQTQHNSEPTPAPTGGSVLGAMAGRHGVNSQEGAASVALARRLGVPIVDTMPVSAQNGDVVYAANNGLGDAGFFVSDGQSWTPIDAASVEVAVGRQTQATETPQVAEDAAAAPTAPPQQQAEAVGLANVDLDDFAMRVAPPQFAQRRTQLAAMRDELLTRGRLDEATAVEDMMTQDQEAVTELFAGQTNYMLQSVGQLRTVIPAQRMQAAMNLLQQSPFAFGPDGSVNPFTQQIAESLGRLHQSGGEISDAELDQYEQQALTLAQRLDEQYRNRALALENSNSETAPGVDGRSPSYRNPTTGERQIYARDEAVLEEANTNLYALQSMAEAFDGLVARGRNGSPLPDETNLLAARVMGDEEVAGLLEALNSNSFRLVMQNLRGMAPITDADVRNARTAIVSGQWTVGEARNFFTRVRGMTAASVAYAEARNNFTIEAGSRTMGRDSQGRTFEQAMRDALRPYSVQNWRQLSERVARDGEVVTLSNGDSFVFDQSNLYAPWRYTGTDTEAANRARANATAPNASLGASDTQMATVFEGALASGRANARQLWRDADADERRALLIAFQRRVASGRMSRQDYRSITGQDYRSNR